MSLEAYPDVSLAQARDGMGVARKLLTSGTDPMAQWATEKITTSMRRKGNDWSRTEICHPRTGQEG